MSELEDKREIEELAQAYGDAVMRRDAEAWANTWAKDGKWDLSREMDPVAGRDTLKGFWTQVMEGYPFVVHHVQPAVVEINGDNAKTRFYVTEQIRDAEGNCFRVEGVYNDDVVRTDEGWKFKYRRFDVMYRGPLDLSGDVNGYPEDIKAG